MEFSARTSGAEGRRRNLCAVGDSQQASRMEKFSDPRTRRLPNDGSAIGPARATHRASKRRGVSRRASHRYRAERISRCRSGEHFVDSRAQSRAVDGTRPSRRRPRDRRIRKRRRVTTNDEPAWPSADIIFPRAKVAPADDSVSKSIFLRQRTIVFERKPCADRRRDCL